MSPTAKSFIQACIRANPQKRSNVAKLLKHPFITADDAAPTGDGREKKIEKIIKEICASSFVNFIEGRGKTDFSDFEMLPIIQVDPTNGDVKKPNNPLANIQKRLNEQKMKDIEKKNNSEMNTPKFSTPGNEKERFNFSVYTEETS